MNRLMCISILPDYIGNHSAEFPMGSSGFMSSLRGNSAILFLHSSGNNPDLESLRCYGTMILADPLKVKQF